LHVARFWCAQQNLNFSPLRRNAPELERTWLRINQTWLSFFQERYPEKWPEVQKMFDKGYTPEQFAVEMFMFVQGQMDASQKWGELIEKFIFSNLGLLANRADPCVYSGIYKGKPVILCHATDDFPLLCKDRSTYDEMIVAFWKQWTVHALDQVKMFFGIQFINSVQCVTLDQTHKVKEIVAEVFGQNHDLQTGNKEGYSTPMIAGTEHDNDLAACTPYLPIELAIAQKQTFGFSYCHILGGCMRCALWTRLNILTACLVLAQYQLAPGSLHFCALKHLVGYLWLHPNLPLVFRHSDVPQDVSAINFSILDSPTSEQSVSAFQIDVVPTDANFSYDSDPKSFTSCDNLYMSGDQSPTKRSPMIDNEAPPMVNRITPPITECLVDANLPGGLYERMATSGGSIEMGGTTTISIACKQTCMSESTTEAETAAAAYLGKVIRWLVFLWAI
jgi:hypothetical protein